MATKTKTKKTGLNITVDEAQVSNGAESTILAQEPYFIQITTVGLAPLLMHAWNTESVAAKGAAVKGSKTKKEDDIESYAYRDDQGYLGIPGKCLLGSMMESGKYFQDPRSPRKSARDLIKAGVQSLSVIAQFQPQTKTWDYEDRQRVVIQRSGITRTRPAMNTGWTTTFDLMISAPEYLHPEFIQTILHRAGQLCGLCDYRPSYGRFRITQFEVRKLEI